MIEPDTNHVPRHLREEYLYVWNERYLIMTGGKPTTTAQNKAAIEQATKDAETFLARSVKQREFSI